MASDRQWMNRSRKNTGGRLDPDFVNGVQDFARQALDKPSVVTLDAQGRKCIPCPCKTCANQRSRDVETVKLHLYKAGFCNNYAVWHMHGEHRQTCNEIDNVMSDMVRAVAGQDFDWDDNSPKGVAKKFFEMLAASDTPLWEEEFMKCEKHTILSAVTKALALKSENQFSQKGFDGMMDLFKECLPPSERMTANFYQAKRLIEAMGMDHVKIDVCPNFCMLYYNTKEDLTSCEVCGASRYKPPGPNPNAKLVPQKTLRYLPITPRLQRLYMTKRRGNAMRWHKEGKREKPGIMVHPADGGAWKHFAEKYPEFAKEARNVWLGLTTDGFMPFNSSAAPYSCWPVFLFPYNLPPGMIMKEDSMFLTLVIPGPKHPGRDIDILLQPLIDELNLLWKEGEMTWDASRNENFCMKATLLWTVSDYPAYEMLSGWGTHGKLGCYYCQGETKSFQLKWGGKACWFGCHRCLLPMDHPFRRDKNNFIKGQIETDGPPHYKTGEELLEVVTLLDDIQWGKDQKLGQIEGYGVTHHWQKKCIFWSLPYWKDNLLPHNIDLMHLEKNFADNLINTLLSTAKTKDNEKARKDMAIICNRPSQNLTPDPDKQGKVQKPKAPFALTGNQKRKVLKWIKEVVKFPDGYASNWNRSVNLTSGSLIGLKSHDLHVFMERLLPIAFRDFVPDSVWDVLCEISSFFREICAKELDPSRIDQLEKDVIVTICKMEKIFPPSFFDSMEHLVVHVANEARLGGPVSSRWMYPCERRNKEMRMRVTNKSQVEGSIVEATVVKEISTFCSHYFEENPRNGKQTVSESNPSSGGLSIFDSAGRPGGKENRRILSEDEYLAAHTYVLRNCPEISAKYESEFDTCKRLTGTREQDLEKARQDGYAEWVRKKVLTERDCDRYIRKAGLKPSKQASCYEVYDINGFRFHTENYGINKATNSSGVCIKGEWDENGVQHDYYGVLQEVIELKYDGGNKVPLFKCMWFDITNGVRKDSKHGIVEVKHASRLKGFEPFVLACQATQVVYLPYAADTKARLPWWVAMKVSPKGKFRVDDGADELLEFYQEEVTDNPILESNDEVFDWVNVVIPVDQFDLVDDTIVTGPPVENNDNPQEEGDEGYDTEQEYYMAQIQEELEAARIDDYDADGF